MTETSEKYLVALFQSVSHVIKAERILKEAQVPHKVIPVPRKISSDCGVCIRFLPEHLQLIENTLTEKCETFSIQSL
ncbi:MAG TPA: DUF3343 domain-containing protein [Desulfobacteraceae bacterium]|nr:DUF3343 domain-containing protein [Desulfobacteraceae bacterium]HPJ68088.1 DUF3343 domain-containing protein [Desulfobacteraceae bacterium]HPQ28643.1 DUF3343 domain-containing protein [Desulfobacteraceae bacterium]